MGLTIFGGELDFVAEKKAGPQAKYLPVGIGENIDPYGNQMVS